MGHVVSIGPYEVEALQTWLFVNRETWLAPFRRSKASLAGHCHGIVWAIRTNNPREKSTPKLTYRLPEKSMAQENQLKPMKRLVGAEGFEPPTR